MSNFIITNYDTSKIFLGENEYEVADYTNSSGSEVTLAAGTLLGRISATGKVVPLTSAAVDGSQFPVGILAKQYKVANGATKSLTFCTKGKVSSGKIIFSGADTLETVVSSRRLRDRIAADTIGIVLVNTTELSAYDNQ